MPRICCTTKSSFIRIDTANIVSFYRMDCDASFGDGYFYAKRRMTILNSPSEILILVVHFQHHFESRRVTSLGDKQTSQHHSILHSRMSARIIYLCGKRLFMFQQAKHLSRPRHRPVNYPATAHQTASHISRIAASESSFENCFRN